MLQSKEIKGKRASVAHAPKKRPTKALEAIAYHEAGHALAAYEERIRIKRVTIKPEETYSGCVFFTKPCVDSSLEHDHSRKQTLRVERRVRVLLAGVAAQRRFSPHSIRHYHAKSDLKDAFSLVGYIAGPPEEISAYINLLNIQTKNMINLPLNWSAIQALAEALLSHETISGKRARAIIEKVLSKTPNQLG